jgi:hypothetical protein
MTSSPTPKIRGRGQKIRGKRNEPHPALPCIGLLGGFEIREGRIMKLQREVSFICPSCEEALEITCIQNGSGYTKIIGRCYVCRAWIDILMAVDNPPNTRHIPPAATAGNDGQQSKDNEVSDA